MIPIERLVLDAGPIRARYLDVTGYLPVGLVSMLQPVAYIVFHQLEVLGTQARIERRSAQRSQAEAADKKAAEEQSKYAALVSKSADLETRLEGLRKERDELQSALEAKIKDIADVEALSLEHQRKSGRRRT
ncbi:hypothetical protein PR202_ga27644 [Eleusine coracana subsp. coracana]|uniref:DUF1409 domain-containing protein n=1 Tax=Eleusine coracana subsp. coracana TaxID=191504 RepID=A0AAV5DH76_ELECO|nr:hypothetical protein PR202_ga27644 [Eleusine coracana subsp. coracana]